jgi:hypothetical protein
MSEKKTETVIKPVDEPMVTSTLSKRLYGSAAIIAFVGAFEASNWGVATSIFVFLGAAFFVAAGIYNSQKLAKRNKVIIDSNTAALNAWTYGVFAESVRGKVGNKVNLTDEDIKNVADGNPVSYMSGKDRYTVRLSEETNEITVRKKAVFTQSTTSKLPEKTNYTRPPTF